MKKEELIDEWIKMNWIKFAFEIIFELCTSFLQIRIYWNLKSLCNFSIFARILCSKTFWIVSKRHFCIILAEWVKEDFTNDSEQKNLDDKLVNYAKNYDEEYFIK